MGRRKDKSALHAALDARKARAVERLLEDGADADERSEHGWTPLHVAAVRGDAAMTALLLRRGADPKATAPDGADPLILAAYSGNVEVLDRLVDAGADVTTHGGAAMAKALWRDHAAVVRRLLDHGAPADHVDPGLGNTLLETALSLGRFSLVEPLVAAGARPDGAGFTRPLTHAVAKDRPDLVDALLAAGADPGVRNSYGDTPMHMAASCGATALAARLFEAGAALEPEETRARRTPLHEAALAGQTAMVRWLLDKGAHLHRLDADGKNALTLARANLHDDTAAALVCMGAHEQPEFAPAVAEGRREASEQEARSRAEAAKIAAFDGQPGQVKGGAFTGMRGVARSLDDGRLEAVLSIFGRNVAVTLQAGQFTFDGSE